VRDEVVREGIMVGTKVAIVSTQEKPHAVQVERAVREAVRLAGGLAAVIGKGSTVIIKPNLVAAKPPETGATTDPRVCRAIADIVRELGARPIIAESSFVGLDTEEAIRVAGYDGLREEGYEVVDLKNSAIEKITVPVPSGAVLTEVSLPRIVAEADALITVAKMKTHDQSGVTLAVKNLKGVLPDSWKRKFHHTFGVFESTADLLGVVKPCFAVIDGIVAMEGLGPAFGQPVEMNLILAGRDAVAVDTVCASVMGFALEDCGCVREAARRGLGVGRLGDIDVQGVPVADVQRRFKRSEEAIAEAISLPPGLNIIVGEKTCSGCRNQLLSTLFDLQAANLLDKAAGWTVVCGKLDELPDVQADRLLLVGACLSRFKGAGTFVQGCPPNSRDVIRGFGVAQAVGMVDIDALDAEEH
jgi:uncharacterized protein (DUF362 family)